MDEEVPTCPEGAMKSELDVGPPVLESQSEDSGNAESDSAFEEGTTLKDTNLNCSAPVLSVMKVPDVDMDPENALRSPPKLLPAVAAKSEGDESKTPGKPLTGSMKNTPASLSIIEAPGKSTRSTRSSIDPSFAAKQRSFLNKVHNALSSTHYNDDIDDISGDSDDETVDKKASDDKSPEYMPGLEEVPKKLMNGIKRRREDSVLKSKVVPVGAQEPAPTADTANQETSEPSPKKFLAAPDDGKIRDIYCWYCHREETELFCASCPRGFHSRCLRKPLATNPEEDWVCIECSTILKAENQETRSKALKMLSLDQLCKLLLYAVNRMKSCVGAEVFENAVDLEQFPSYKDHIINPMHLSLLEKNIKKKMYGSTEAFIGDAMWILHNCIIFNSFNSKLTSIAKNILKLCKQEMAEIENCPDCYHFAYTEDENFFIKVCKPHLLVWAKLKGFPYWPAKVIRASSDSLDVRFFGAHDRAWVPVRDCYLYSEENPNVNTPGKSTPTNVQQKKRSSRNNLDTCIEEVKLHIMLLKKRFTTFQYAVHRTHVNIRKLDDHLKFMLPDLDSSSSKSPLIRRGSFELESSVSGPPVKRLKADSSIAQPNKIVMNSADSNSPKENGSTKGSPTLKKMILKNVHDITSKSTTSPGASSSATEHSAGVGKEDGTATPKTNGSVVQSKTIGNAKLISVHTVTPGQSNTFITPLSSSEATLAELRLKSKDVRKIGLVDRLQEKLNNMLKNRSPSPNDSGDDPKEEIKEEVQSDAENNEEDSANVSKESASLDNVLGSEDKPSSPEQSELMKKAVKNILDSFKMIEKQPKVVLTKLKLDDKFKPIEKSEKSNASVVKEEQVSSEDEEDINDMSNECHTSDKAKEMSENHLISDHKSECKEGVSKTSIINMGPGPASRTKPAKDVATSIASVPESLKSNVQSGELSIQLGSVLPKSAPVVVPKNAEKIVKKKKKKTKDSSVTLATSNKNGKVTESPEDLDKASLEASSELALKCINQEPSGPEQNSQSKVSQSMACPTKTSLTFKAVHVPISAKTHIYSLVHPNQDKTVKPPAKTVSKPRPVQPKRMSEQKEDEDVAISTESVKLMGTEKAPRSSTLSPSPVNSDASSRSLLSNNVTVYLEPQESQTLEGGKSDSEDPLFIVSSPQAEAEAKSIKCSNLSQSRVIDTANKFEKQKSQTNSPSKLASPTVVALRPQTKSSPTSLLKPKAPNASETSHSGEITANTSSSHITLNNTKSSNVEVATSSNLATIVPKTPTFVTISSGSGLRLLPKAVPIVLRAPYQNPLSTSPAAASAPAGASAAPVTELTALDNTSVAITGRMSAGALVTSASSLAVPASAAGPQAKERLLKKPGQINTVAILKAAPASLKDLKGSKKELPTLSVGSVSSLKCTGAASTTTNAGCRPLTHTTASGAALMSSSEDDSKSSKLCVSKKPISSHLRNQAQKLTQMFMGSMKDFLSEMGSSGSLEAQIRILEHDMELMQWRHQQELAELKHNTELIIAEIKDRAKIESQRAVYQAIVNNTRDRETAVAAAVSAAKEKQWCAFCKKEAMFYCCWNTSYCDYNCQQNHWRVHSLTCTQNSCAEHPQPSSGDSQTPQPASSGRIITQQKVVLSPPHLKKRGTPSRLSN